MVTSAATGAPTGAELYRAWIELRAARPDLRARDCATVLGVSEARLAAARCRQGEGCEVRATPAPLLSRIATLGTVMALTRSSAAVLENIGTYGPPDIGEHTGIVIGDNIDLRIFPSGWKTAYALTEPTAAGPLRSIQIFNAAGAASHKVYLRSSGDVAAFEALVGELALPAVNDPVESAAASAGSQTADESVDLIAYQREFGAMQDTHDFFMLLHRFALTREQGLRLAGTRFAWPLAANAHRQLFSHAADGAIPLMIFVANSGMVQISSGPIPQPAFAGSWCNLIDPRFNLHLDEAEVGRAWVVRKPTVNGIVTSLELYAADGDLVAQVFGERHAGEIERADWAAAIAALPLAS